MKITEKIICTLLLLFIGFSLNNIEAQTLEDLEIKLSKTITTSPSTTFWEDSWDDWADNMFWGVNYSGSERFPISFSLQAHYHFCFLSFGLGFAPYKYTFDYNSSTPDSSLSSTIIYNGDTTREYSYFTTDSNYSVTPNGWAMIEPGVNFNFVTLSCGIGLWWGDGEKRIIRRYSPDAASSFSRDCSYGWFFSPNLTVHLPVPGTENHVHYTINAGYNFLLPKLFEGDSVVKRLTLSGSGWKFGLGLEFKID